jgi:hypothetical protein
MKISIDTKEDSHEEIKKVIKMLQNLVGESQEVFTNEPKVTSQEASPMANIFGDVLSQTQETRPEITQSPQETTQEIQTEQSESTEDLFAELFSEEELKKMDEADIKKDEEEEEVKAKKKYNIEIYEN